MRMTKDLGLSEDMFDLWKVHIGPWLLGQRLRILMVLDGSITLSPTGFGLGLVTDTLRDPGFAWWVRFSVDVAHRQAPAGPADPRYAMTYTGFRFDQPGFDINAYDQVWFFGFNPDNFGGPDSNITLPDRDPLSDAELLLVANWMDRGGGVFATGDHDYLGATLCSRIPRVRTMRRWTNAQNVPPIGGPTRIDTNQPANAAQAAGQETMPFENQGDAVPQPIEPVYRELFSWSPFERRRAPHPILCTPAGVITRFPDHPHEGEVLGGADVVLNTPLGIPGYAGPEYPGGAGGPLPEVIAKGRSTHQFANHFKGIVNERLFGLIGVYDGDPAGVGRVVVDSTWHHWFSENLVGFANGNPDVYRDMQAYYRNVALWLATPAQRSSMLTKATWGVITGSGPMVFPPKTDIWELGGRAMDVLGRTVSACLLREWVFWFIPYRIVEYLYPKDPRPPDPCLSCPPFELFERSIVGGIAKGMLPLALDYQTELAQGRRPQIDATAVARGATRGLAEGRRELTRVLRRGAVGLARLEAAVDSEVRGKVLAPDVGTRDVRVVVEALQLRDPADAALLDDTPSAILELRVSGHLEASHVLERLEVGRGVEASVPIVVGHVFETTAQEADQLAVSLVIRSDGDPSRSMPRVPEAGLVLDGPPSEWLGRHVSGPDRAWRMVVRIEPKERSTPARRKRRG